MYRTKLNVLFVAVPLLFIGASVFAQIEIVDPVTYGVEEVTVKNPKGIAYHPNRNTLFIARNSRVVELDLAGNALNTFSVKFLTDRARGIDYDPLTDTLLLVDDTDRIYQVNADGSPAERNVYLTLIGSPSASGIAIDRSTGAIWIADEHAESVREYSRFGNALNGFSTDDILPDFKEPKGLSFFGEYLLVADDSGGSSHIYLISRFGALIQFVLNTEDYGLTDPEGVVSINNNQICIVSNSDSKMLCFDVGESIVPENFLAIPLDLGIPDSLPAVAVSNSIAAENSVEIKVLDEDGTLIHEATLFDPIKGFGQTSFLSREVTNLEDVSTLILQGSAGPIQGFSMLVEEDLEFLDGVGGQTPTWDELYFPIVTESTTTTSEAVFLMDSTTAVMSDGSTAIFLFNPSTTEAAEVEVHLYDAVGTELASNEISLSPYGAFRGNLSDLFESVLNVLSGWVSLESSQPIQGLAFLNDGKNLIAVEGLPKTKSVSLWAPHAFVGIEGSSTRLRLLNLEESSVSGTVKFYGEDGLLQAAEEFRIGAGEVLDSELGGLLGLRPLNPIVGFLQVEFAERDRQAEASGVAVLGSVTYIGQQNETASSLPLESHGLDKAAFFHVAQSEVARVFQGMAILNTTAEEALINIEVFDELGETSGVIGLTLPTMSRVSGLLTDPVFFGSDFEQVKGHIRIDSNVEVIAYSLFGGDRYLAAIQPQKRLK